MQKIEVKDDGEFNFTKKPNGENVAVVAVELIDVLDDKEDDIEECAVFDLNDDGELIPVMETK